MNIEDMHDREQVSGMKKAQQNKGHFSVSSTWWMYAILLHFYIINDSMKIIVIDIDIDIS